MHMYIWMVLILHARKQPDSMHQFAQPACLKGKASHIEQHHTYVFVLYFHDIQILQFHNAAYSTLLHKYTVFCALKQYYKIKNILEISCYHNYF